MIAAFIQPLSACSNKSAIDGNRQQQALFDSNEQTYLSNVNVSRTTIDIDRNFRGIDVEMQTYVVFEQSNELSVKSTFPSRCRRR